MSEDLIALVQLLSRARQIMWRRIQAGGYDSEEQAKAAIAVWAGLEKAQTLCLEHFAQLRLPEGG